MNIDDKKKAAYAELACLHTFWEAFLRIGPWPSVEASRDIFGGTPCLVGRRWPIYLMETYPAYAEFNAAFPDYATQEVYESALLFYQANSDTIQIVRSRRTALWKIINDKD